jgi:hypothetical protein
MAIYFAIEGKGNKGEFAEFAKECISKGRKFKIATDDPSQEFEIVRLCEESGIKEMKPAFIKDSTNKDYY